MHMFSHMYRCDPHPDMSWQGSRLISRIVTRSGTSNTCEWGNELVKQCYGLGDEVSHACQHELLSVDSICVYITYY